MHFEPQLWCILTDYFKSVVVVTTHKILQRFSLSLSGELRYETAYIRAIALTIEQF
ncbi:hypothetical protein ADA01nite_21340 [Aneurinibacillus danicus]|uniref:Uncharacterized protein n=1 Tax=Aneurinibacillus danicus TaxID=267746 RepID=A0A511V6U7_9BACL|nr:hypothetical protein ADA01nite_21340 [Aneurinibacillus danicus]